MKIKLSRPSGFFQKGVPGRKNSVYKSWGVGLGSSNLAKLSEGSNARSRKTSCLLAGPKSEWKKQRKSEGKNRSGLNGQGKIGGREAREIARTTSERGGLYGPVGTLLRRASLAQVAGWLLARRHSCVQTPVLPTSRRGCSARRKSGSWSPETFLSPWTRPTVSGRA